MRADSFLLHVLYISLENQISIICTSVHIRIKAILQVNSQLMLNYMIKKQEHYSKEHHCKHGQRAAKQKQSPRYISAVFIPRAGGGNEIYQPHHREDRNKAAPKYRAYFNAVILLHLCSRPTVLPCLAVVTINVVTKPKLGSLLNRNKHLCENGFFTACNAQYGGARRLGGYYYSLSAL